MGDDARARTPPPPPPRGLRLRTERCESCLYRLKYDKATRDRITALDAEATRAALAQYESLSFKSQYNAGSGAIAFNPSTEGEWAGVRVRFTTDAPLETYRDFIQGYLDAETEREAREQDGRAEGAQGS